MSGTTGPADARYSVAACPSDSPPTAVHAAELRRHDAAAVLAPGDTLDAGVLAGSFGLAKLQTYLPTGTWVTYTALETWAFSLRPNDPPVSPLSNCNAHQRTAFLTVLVLCAALAFFSSFLKRFVYDAGGTHVVFPPPDSFTVAASITDPVTGVQFPCRTRAQRYCWPLVDAAGALVYDESGARLRVAVFRAAVPVRVHRPRAWRLRACFGPADPPPAVPPAPYLRAPPLPAPPPPAPGTPRRLAIDDAARAAPALAPRWAHTLRGAPGSAAYADLRARVWAHALVSALAFLALALGSAQARGCLYPAAPDFVLPPLQTGVLLLLAAVAALAVRDHAVGFGQQAVVGLRAPQRGGVEAEAEVPRHLSSVVEMVVWVGRQDSFLREKA